MLNVRDIECLVPEFLEECSLGERLRVLYMFRQELKKYDGSILGGHNESIRVEDISEVPECKLSQARAGELGVAS